MPSDPRTAQATNCADCSLGQVPKLEAATLLQRLPSRLWNRNVPLEPSTPALLAGDQLAEDTIFGPVAPADATPQYELARVAGQIISDFVEDWHRIEALQLGLGDAAVIDGRVVGEGAHATGADLDRMVGQYGIGRPWGFTDCCYWRLFQLLVFTPGCPGWLLRELGELYTGIRPDLIETPCKIALAWPDTVFNVQAPYLNQNAVAGQSFLIDPNSPFEQLTDFDAYAADSVSSPGATFLGQLPQASGGLSLLQALYLAKADGMALELINAPEQGASGCLGAQRRGQGFARGRIVG